MADFLSEKILTILAINIGLVILLAWFFILLLMIREFRTFANQMVNRSGVDNKTLNMCQESVDNALNYTTDNAETIEQLMKIQKALEIQIKKLEKAARIQASPEDKETINHLNGQLEESERLIKKLKNDLDKSIKGLQITRKKLYAQYETVDLIKAEKIELEKQFSQLEEEYLRISRSKEAQSSHFSPNSNEMNNAITQELMANHKKEIQKMRNELDNIQNKLQHAEKEKNFIEKRYMDMVAEKENKKQ